MYTILNSDIKIRNTNVKVFGLDYVKRELVDRFIGRYKEYRSINPGTIKSNHLLIKLLDMLSGSFAGDLPDHYLSVTQQVNRLAGQMGFVTSAHHGSVNTESTFYGRGVGEIIIAVGDDNLTPGQIWFNWRNLSAVRVLSHPFMGCGIVELDGSQSYSGLDEAALSVIELNIPLLSCQFECWKLAVGAAGAESSATTRNFISQVVIPNMLTSHLDVAVLNTVHYLLGSDRYLKIDNDMPFYITDLYPRLETGLGEIIDRFSKQSSYYKDILANIPVFGDEVLLQTVRMPDIAFTNQAIWALMIARLDCIGMLFKLDDVSKTNKNTEMKTKINRSLIEADSGKYLVNQVPRKVSEDVEGYIERNIRPYL